MKKNAFLSNCGQYRYILTRVWDSSLGFVRFILLNPSTADHEQDDPTVRRCVNYAKSWGCGGLEILNLFAYRATSPKELKNADRPIGSINDLFLVGDMPGTEYSAAPKYVICGWGTHGRFMDRGSDVMEMLGRVHCLKINGDGTPGHPLYLRADLKPIKYRW